MEQKKRAAQRQKAQRKEKQDYFSCRTVNSSIKKYILLGTGRIQQGLYSLPSFMRNSLQGLSVNISQNIMLSITIINEVLTALN